MTEARRKELLKGTVLLDVLDYVLEEQLQGRRPNTSSVADRFKLSVEESEMIREHLEEIGELG